ncbi:hypothetical protein QFC19_004477 [Naganishia cerealis]|uniref:Uncharacterized protein n=1 Tax=Naganishia cerealis TaxID=610337 RepID=A0ACC2VW11_9TREE|nr:hypothetical protein QFC19_004477 [Naganishia cerealis]
MPEVEERDVETRKAYGKLGYVWDTTFDCWVHMTPQGKTEPMDEASSPDADDRGAASSRSRSANVESSTTFSGDRSSPTAYMPTSPPTMTMQQNISLRGSSPISKTPTFSSPFIQSPFVRSTVTPKHLLKSKHKKTNSVLARSVYATPTQPMRTVAPNTVESIDPLDDIEELDKTTPVLPKRVSVRSEAPRPLKQLEHPSSELDGTDPLVDGFSDIPLEHVWMPINVPPSISSSKRKATAPLESLHLKKRHQLESL